MSASEIIDLLIEAARQGREAVESCMSGERFKQVSRKKDGSLLTRADLASHHAVCSFLDSRLPNVPILSEEACGSASSITHGQWIVLDPLDGTTNFTRGIPFSSISVAYTVDGVPQAGVVMPISSDYCYGAVRDSFAAVIDSNGARTAIRCANRPLEDSVLCVTCNFSIPDSREIWWKWLEKLRPPACFRLRILESSALEMCLLAGGRIDGYLHPADKPWDMAAAGLIVQEAGAKVFDIDGGPWSLQSSGIIALSPGITDLLTIIL